MKSTLLLLFFLATLCSQSAMDVIAILMTLTCVVSLIRDGEEIRSLRLGNEKWFVAFVASILVSFLFFAPNLDHLVFRLVELKWYLFLYVLVWFFRGVRIDEKKIRTAGWILGLASVWAIVIWFLKFDPLHPGYEMSPWSVGIRTGGLLGDSMTFAHLYGIYFAFLTPWVYWQLTKAGRGEDSGRNLVVLTTSMIILAVALILSFTRGVWVASFISTLIFLLSCPYKHGKKVAIGLVGLVVLLFLSVPILNERLNQSIHSTDERSIIWRAHFQIFKEHPIFGVGYGENIYLSPEIYRRLGIPDTVMITHAHNQYLHMAAGLGVVGLFIYLGLLGSFLWMIIRKLRQKHLAESTRALLWGLLTAQIFFFLGGLTEANFEHSKIKYTMGLVWALSVCLTRPKGAIKI